MNTRLEQECPHIFCPPREVYPQTSSPNGFVIDFSVMFSPRPQPPSQSPGYSPRPTPNHTAGLLPSRLHCTAPSSVHRDLHSLTSPRGAVAAPFRGYKTACQPGLSLLFVHRSRGVPTGPQVQAAGRVGVTGILATPHVTSLCLGTYLGRSHTYTSTPSCLVQWVRHHP